MAIARDNYARDDREPRSSSPVTYSYTCSGSNRLLIVGIYSQSGDIITGCSYAGTAMTKIGNTINPKSGEYMYCYLLVNPATGANNLSVTYTGTGNKYFYINLISYTGAEQANQPDANTDGTKTSSSSFSNSITTTDNNCWIAIFLRNVAGDITDGNYWDKLGGTSETYGDTNGAITPAGSTTQTATSSASGAWGYFQVSISPAASTAFTQTCSETLSLTDTISRSTKFNKSISETLSMTEAVSKSQGMSKTLTETLSLSDAISSAIQRGLLLLETIHLTDTLQKTTRFAKTLTESISLTDTLASAKQFFVTLSETIGLTDVISKSVNFAKTLSETLHLTDVIKVTGWFWNYLFKRTSSYDYKSKSTNTWTYKDK